MGEFIKVDPNAEREHAKALEEYAKNLEETSRGIDMNLLPMLQTGWKTNGSSTAVDMIRDRVVTLSDGMHDVAVFLVQIIQGMDEATRILVEAQNEQAAGR